MPRAAVPNSTGPAIHTRLFSHAPFPHGLVLEEGEFHAANGLCGHSFLFGIEPCAQGTRYLRHAACSLL